MSFPLFVAFWFRCRHRSLGRTNSAIAPDTGGTAVALGIEPAYAKDIVLGSLAEPVFQASRRGRFGTMSVGNCAIGGWTVWAA